MAGKDKAKKITTKKRKSLQFLGAFIGGMGGAVWGIPDAFAYAARDLYSEVSDIRESMKEFHSKKQPFRLVGYGLAITAQTIVVTPLLAAGITIGGPFWGAWKGGEKGYDLMRGTSKAHSQGNEESEKYTHTPPPSFPASGSLAHSTFLPQQQIFSKSRTKQHTKQIDSAPSRAAVLGSRF